MSQFIHHNSQALACFMSLPFQLFVIVQRRNDDSVLGNSFNNYFPLGPKIPVGYLIKRWISFCAGCICIAAS